MTDKQKQEDRLKNLEDRADDLDQAAEKKHDRDTHAELEEEYGYDGVGEPAANLVTTSAIATFDEDDADLKAVIDGKKAKLRDAVENEEPVSDESLDELEHLLNKRTKRLGVDDGDPA